MSKKQTIKLCSKRENDGTQTKEKIRKSIYWHDGSIANRERWYTLHPGHPRHIYKIIRLYALKRATTRAILNRITQDYIPTTGKPEAILSDNGTQFTSRLWARELENLNIKTNFTTKYHPQSNPVEKYNRVIGRLLRTYCHNQHTKWPDYLDTIEHWLNRLRSEVTETTPNQAFNGTRPTNILEKIIEFPPQPAEEKHDELICVIADRIKTKAHKKEEKYNRKKIYINFKIGDKVLTKYHHLSNAGSNEIKKLFNILEDHSS